jgi:hypothetical protein
LKIIRQLSIVGCKPWKTRSFREIQILQLSKMIMVMKKGVSNCVLKLSIAEKMLLRATLSPMNPQHTMANVFQKEMLQSFLYSSHAEYTIIRIQDHSSPSEYISCTKTIFQ